MNITKKPGGIYEILFYDSSGKTFMPVECTYDQIEELYYAIHDIILTEIKRKRKASQDHAARIQRRNKQLVHNIERGHIPTKPRHDISNVIEDTPKFITETELSDMEKQRIKNKLVEENEKSRKRWRAWYLKKRANHETQN